MTGFREAMNDVITTIEGANALDAVAGPLSGWVQRATSQDEVKSALSGTWLGHQLHPVLTDLPIGAWTMASTLDCISGRSGADEARRLVGLGVLAAVPTAVTGAADWSDTYGASQRTGLVHALCNVTATLLQATSWIVRGRGHRRAGIGLSGAGLGIALFSSYLGGHLSFVQGVGVNHTAFEPTVKKWTDVAALTDLSPDQPVRVTAGRVPVVLVKHDEGIYALSATCVHAGGPLDQGEVLENGCIRCPWHASTYQLSDGSVVRGPASMDQPSWEVQVEGGRVSVRSRQTAHQD
jgi:nitrite reductase/ring-hydroxylating ferredoxin subunit